ncbi:YhdP family protein [Aromatoleum sp.]|uniref:YhdP family protein n=1 Tax=Aromatoleum sp. TaxID=2307007 RepID=UPI002FCC87EB
MLATVAVVLFFVAGGLFLFVRDVMLPRADQYRAQIAGAIGDAVGLPVSIDALSGDLSGWHPRLHLSGLLLLDRAGRPALRLDAVDATIAWSSLLRGQPHFQRLEIRGPELALRREADGRVFVAGIPIEPGGEGGGFSDWLLGQREIVIRDAALTWSDAQRTAPELRLDRVNLRLSHVGGRYRFGLQAQPPAGLAGALDARGDIVSREPADPSTWSGKLFVALDQTDLGAWRAWVDYPVELTGHGGLRAWFGLARGQPTTFAADFALAGVATRLGAELPELKLASARGAVSGTRDARDALTLATRSLELVTADGLRVEPTDVDLVLRERIDGAYREGELEANRLDLGALAGLAAHLPFDPGVRSRLAAFDPRGRLDALRLTWRGPLEAPVAWSLNARFHAIGFGPQERLPGLSGFSGEIAGDERAGRFRLAGEDAALEMPAVFPEPRLAFSRLRVDGGWARRDGRLEIALDSANFENPDAAGSASGRYRFTDAGPGEIDLSARLTRANSRSVWRYLPHVVNDDTRSWLRRSLTGGVVPDARLRLKGNLADFPYADGKSGQFLVTTRVAGARLDYAEGWPAITDIDGEIRFEGPLMRISAQRARIFDVALNGVVAEVPELGARHGEIMTVRGRASGRTAGFLRFVAESPVSGRIGGFTDGMQAEGVGALDLKLVMPLHHVSDTTVKGEYRFTENRLKLVDALPPLADAAATVRFTEKDLTIPEGRARLYGEPMQVTAATAKDGGVTFRASGAAAVQAVRVAHEWPALAHLSGSAPWQAAIDVGPKGSRVTVQSDLVGVASSLPEPLNKSATTRWPTSVELEFPAGGAREVVRAALDDRGQLEVVRRRQGAEWVVERGGFAFFTPLRTAERGVLVAAELDEFDLDGWRDVFDPEPAIDAQEEQAGEADAPPLAGIDLRAKRARAFGQPLSALNLTAQTTPAGWKGRVASQEVEGSFDWRDAGEGALRARLKRLAIGADDEAGKAAPNEEPAAGADADESPRRLPELDIVAEQFRVRGMELGRLELQARNRRDLWHLDSLAVSNPDGRFTGTGQWRPGARPLTELDFRLEAHDIGRFVARLGYEQAVRGGDAVLAGKLRWRGAPTQIHYPSLSGSLTLDAENGQFRKLEPGMGRLLGVLSLQALPRRLTLDFRDVFSEGFAFDRISGSIDVTAGVMRTDDLLIRGPAARIQMRGSADTEKETQDLRVTVQPTLSESVAIGAAAGLINPVAGVVAYVAQKALSDPIERLFAFDYAITGSWDDPKVEKLANRAQDGKPPTRQE